jgi:hypothetical protein
VRVICLANHAGVASVGTLRVPSSQRQNLLKLSRDDIAVIPAVYSLAVWRSWSFDCRPMTLRHYVSVVLLFG